MSELPEQVLSRIVRMGQSEWPDDAAMQRALMERQASAWHELQALQAEFGDDDFMRQVFEYAAEDWPDDFEMELHTVRMQASAAMAYERFAAEGVPEEVVAALRVEVSMEIPRDQEMRLVMLEQRIERWRTSLD